MDNQFAIRELSLMIIVSTGWILGYLEHKSPETNMTIRLPIVIRIFFGKIENKELSIRGVLIQTFMFTLFLYITLYNLERISSNQTVRLIGWTNLILLVLAGIHYLKKNRRL